MISCSEITSSSHTYLFPWTAKRAISREDAIHEEELVFWDPSQSWICCSRHTYVSLSFYYSVMFELGHIFIGSKLFLADFVDSHLKPVNNNTQDLPISEGMGSISNVRTCIRIFI